MGLYEMRPIEWESRNCKSETYDDAIVVETAELGPYVLVLHSRERGGRTQFFWSLEFDGHDINSRSDRWPSDDAAKMKADCEEEFRNLFRGVFVPVKQDVASAT